MAHAASRYRPTETAEEFVERASPTSPSSALLGPWLWVHSAIDPSTRPHMTDTQRDDFIEKGTKLLEEFSTGEAGIKKGASGGADTSNPAGVKKKPRASKAQAAATETARLQLKDRLLQAAQDHNAVFGKWMLFPSEEYVVETWLKVVKGVLSGRLGPTAKVATESAGYGRLICIYTQDWSDKADVRRVLDELLDLGLFSDSGKGIYYKCDAYTYLGLETRNQYGLAASLYSSKEVLERPKK